MESQKTHVELGKSMRGRSSVMGKEEKKKHTDIWVGGGEEEAWELGLMSRRRRRRRKKGSSSISRGMENCLRRS